MSQWNVDVPSCWTRGKFRILSGPPHLPRDSLLRCPRLARPWGRGGCWRRSEGKKLSCAARRQFVFFTVVELVDSMQGVGPTMGLGDLGTRHRGEVELFWGLLWGKLGDAWCCLGMVDSWWLLWFLVLDLTKSERFKHVQSKHRNVTKHQHDFLKRGGWIFVVPTPSLRLSPLTLSWDRFWQKMWLGFSKLCALPGDWALGPGTVHLGDGSPWPWTSPLEVTKRLDHVPGDGWWRITNFYACLVRF